MIAPARLAAYEALRAVATGRADLATAIADARDALTDDRDRSLLVEIATGVERWRGLLDHLIVSLSRRPLARLDAEVLLVLRMSLYQLLHLTRVPASAVVDDAVNLTKKLGKKSASGLVNAVLRTASRQRNALPLPVRPENPADLAQREAALDYLSVTCAHPRWLAERWLERFGFEGAERWMQFNNGAAPVTLRVNPLKATRAAAVEAFEVEEVEVQPTTWAPDGLVVTGGNAFKGLTLLQGVCLPQDEASQIVALLAGPNPGPLVLDTCASPGGKATALAAAIGRAGRLVACDRRPRRVELLERTIRVSGAKNVSVAQADLLEPLPFRAGFDCVFVDAPCSGLGTLRRDPDIKWRRTPADLAGFAVAQLKMLGHAAAVVKPGGRLVYATCSSEPDENDAVVAGFLATQPAFRLAPLREAAPAIPEALVDREVYLRTIPDRHGLEAFFGVVLLRDDPGKM